MTSTPDLEAMTKSTLVMMAGLPGTGKSVLALEVGEVLGWPIIDKDTMKTTLLEAGIEERVAAGLAYELTLALAEDLLVRQRVSVIVDTPLTFHRTLTRAESMTKSAGARLKVVFCQCSDELRDQRMQHRPPRASQPASLQSIGGNPVVQFDYLPVDTLVLDTSAPIENLVRTAVDYLRPLPQPMTPEERAEANRMLAGIRQAFGELLVPELRGVAEAARRSNLMSRPGP